MPEQTLRDSAGGFGLWLDQHYRKVLVAILALTIAIGLVRLHSGPASTDSTHGQTDNYWPLINHLLDGDGYTLCYPLYFPFCPNGEAPPTAMREPVPTLLFAAAAAVSGRSLLFTLHVQVLLCGLIALLTFRFARRIAGTRAGLFAALAWALYVPPWMWIENQLSADLVGTFFLLWSANVLLLARRSGELKHWIACGLLLGLAALSRSALILMILPWGLAAIAGPFPKSRPRFRANNAVVTAACALAVMSPWAIRNKQVFGKAWLGTSMNGYNVWRMNAQVGTDEPLHFVDSFEADTMLQALVQRRSELRGDENEAEMDRVYAEEGMAAIKKNPMKYLRLCIYRIPQLLFNWNVRAAYGMESGMVDHVITLQQGLFLLLATIGLWNLRRTHWVWLLAIGIQVAAYTALVAQVRYMIPVMPLIMAFAAYAAERFLWRQTGR